jgi:uncharacterized protein YceK
MKKLLCVLAALALLLSGCGSVSNTSGGASASGSSASGSSGSSQTATETQADKTTLDSLLDDIAGAVPGTAGSSLKQAAVAGELLDWVADGKAASTPSADVEDWVAGRNTLSAADLAYAYSAVLDFADRIVAGEDVSAELSDAGYTLKHDSYNAKKYYAAAKLLSPLFTKLLTEPTTAYTDEGAGDYSAVTADAFDGIWVNSSNGEEYGEMLVFSGDKCRVVIPYLSDYGDKPFDFRVRDRSDKGFCPALEINSGEDGNYEAALTYYVSGIDASHFWCNTQSERFDKIEMD